MTVSRMRERYAQTVLTSRITYVDGRILLQHRKWKLKRDTEACSCNHCCSGKAIIITYSECVFVALGIQHAAHICLIHWRLSPVRLYDILPHYPIKGAIFGKKVIKRKIYLFSLQTLSKNLLLQEEFSEIS